MARIHPLTSVTLSTTHNIFQAGLQWSPQRQRWHNQKYCCGDHRPYEHTAGLRVYANCMVIRRGARVGDILLASPQYRHNDSPMIGGSLSRPTERFPDTFGNSEFLRKYPYFLPCAFSATFSAFAWLLTFVFLREVRVNTISVRLQPTVCILDGSFSQNSSHALDKET